MNEQDLHSKGFIRQPDGTWSKGTVVKVGREPLHTHKPKPAERSALERGVSRKAKSSHRVKIIFTGYYFGKPLDWDNASIKELQDMLVKSGILDGDGWDELEGHGRSRKVATKEEERTEIEIFDLTGPSASRI